MNKIYKQARLHAGFTMVEIMVAIAVGLILTSVVLQIFISNKQTYRVQEALSRVQENGRYALNEVGKDIRMAGYLGCFKSATVNNIAEPVGSNWVSFDQGITGYELPSVPAGLTAAEVLAGTDVVRVKHASEQGIKLKGNLTAVNANIQIASNPYGFQADDILFISDCVNADVFRATNASDGASGTTIAHANSTNTTQNLSKPYGENAEVMRFESQVYYVGNGTGGCGANMLCRKRLSGINMVAEELVEGAENLQILYGEDTNADLTADRYVSAGSVSNMDNVVSVRMSLLLRTNDNNLTPTAQPYTLNGVVVTPTDKRLRRIFTSTINLRNRTP